MKYISSLIALITLVCSAHAASLRTVVYTPTPELESQFLADTTAQYQGKLVRNTDSYTLTLTSRNPTLTKAPCDLEKAVASIVAVTTQSYVYGVCNGMQIERDYELDLLASFFEKTNCHAELSAMIVAVTKRTIPDFEIPPVIFPPDQSTSTLPAPIPVPVPIPLPTGACSVVLNKSNFFSGSPSSYWKVDVISSTPGCSWTATVDVPWVMVTFDSVSVRISVLANTGPFRTARLTVDGVVYIISQEGL